VPLHPELESLLLFQSVLLASLSSTGHAAPVARHATVAVPVWAAYLLAVQAPWRRLQLAPPCGRLSNHAALPCLSLVSGRGSAQSLPAAGSYADPQLSLPRRNDSFRTLGGFVHLDFVASPRLRTGPELSWSTPDSPREDLPKMRLLSPGWGVRYAWHESPVAVGVSACSRVVMIGRDFPVVDPITSEARIEFLLP
jgi:hypothetical protein